jgi:hypothetical protein
MRLCGARTLQTWLRRRRRVAALCLEICCARWLLRALVAQHLPRVEG